MVNPNCTSGEKYYACKNTLFFDTYVCTKQVFVPESDELIPEGKMIADMRNTLNIFQRFFAWLMRYMAWEYCYVEEGKQKKFRWMKQSTFNRYFKLCGRSFFEYNRKERRRRKIRQFIRKIKKLSHKG